MFSRKVWSIIGVLLLLQIGGISIYFLRKPRVTLQNDAVDPSDIARRLFGDVPSNQATNNNNYFYNFPNTANNSLPHQVPSSGSKVTSSIVPHTSNLSIQLEVNELLKRVATRQLSKPMPLRNSDGKSWDKSTFCHSFLINTFPNSVQVCSKGSSDSIACYGNDHDPAHMATCTLRNLAVQPRLLYRSIEGKFDKEGTIYLINNQGTVCANPTVEFISKKVERDDYQLKLLNKIMTSESKPASVCDVWINKTAVFFTNEKYHIYFRLIEYYTVHKALWDLQVNEGDYLVVRISTSEGMRYPEFDDYLFPGAINLKDLPQNATVCFKKVVTIPRCFSSIPFRTKMNGRIRNKCFECHGKGLTGTPFYSFRKRAIKACNLSDDQPRHPGGTIVVISRKPYERYPSDKSQRFERVLTNEDSLVSELKKAFPSAQVSVIHLEDLPICEQIRYAHSADVMLGVHGAGLVHFWWLRDNALAYEMEPAFEVGNPTFKMLTTLTGRWYKSIRISGNHKQVNVDIGRVVKEIKASGAVGHT